ncbi:MAG: protein involved in meta-pathway of phenol degradation, partial [Proteobacteria bacterium]|nr:protein involved in meta-pathway of phenol degradation [Pseudomonadota bacterium]
MKNLKTILLLATPALLASPTVLAFEGAQQYPLGAENFMAGALPPPGNYFINYLVHYQGDLQDNDGNELPVDVKATANALRFIYVSNTKLFGGDWGMHAIVPLVYQKLNTPNPTWDNDWVFGLGDITLDPIIIGWHFPPDWHITVG